MKHANIKALEARLQIAMMASDVNTLDELLATDLIFTNHQGQLVTKAQDLELHKSGLLSISSLEKIEEKIHIHEHVYVVSVLVDITGTYAGNPANGKFRFTRIWSYDAAKKWQVIAAHSSIL